MEYCDYCHENPIATDYGACEECDTYFEENPSGPAVGINGRWYEPGDVGYDWAVSQLAGGPVHVVKGGR